MSEDDVEAFFVGLGSRREGGVSGVKRDDEAFVRGFGVRLLAARRRLGMSRRLLAEESGVSPRYIQLAEAGTGNVSLRVLRSLAGSLGVRPLDLIEARPDSAAHRLLERLDEAQLDAAHRLLVRHFSRELEAGRAARIALVGPPGAGKTWLGEHLAAARGVPFVTFAAALEAAASVPVGELAARFSQPALQRLQTSVLQHLVAAHPAMVLVVGAVPGLTPPVFDAVLRSCRTVWVRLWGADVLLGAGAALRRTEASDAMALLAASEAMFARADDVLDVGGRPAAASLAALRALVG